MGVEGKGPEGEKIVLRLYIRNYFPARIGSGFVGFLFLCYGNLEETSSVTTSYISTLYSIINISKMESITSEANVPKLMG